MAEAGRATVGRDFRWVWRAIGVAIVVVVLFWTLDRLTVYWLARSYVGQVAEVFDLNTHLAQAITYAVFSAISVAGTLALSASKSRRWAGLGALLALLILNSLVLWRGTANQLFARSGEAIKCYVITKDAIRYGERAGVDPETGRMCRPVTQEMVERLRAYERGMRPAQILSGSVQFFDPRTGEPTAWHNTATSGQIELYDLMGFHPVTGEELVPVTREIVERWREQDQKRRDEAAERSRRAPQLIDPDKYAFFDPVGGAPRVWFWRGEGGQWEFYDTRGFHPRTGESLTLISRDAIEAWRASQEERRKAEATREKRAPKPVDPERYAFFDAVSGEPRVWFWKSPSSDYEFFDAPGFHPRTGDTLQAITRDVVNGWRQSLEAAKKRAEDESRRRQIEPIAKQSQLAPKELQKVGELIANQYLAETLDYADFVEWYGKGNVPRLQLDSEKAAYAMRWPERRFNIKRETIAVAIQGDGTFSVIFDIDFFVRSPARNAERKGVSSIAIEARTIGGEVKVVKQNEVLR